MTVDDLPAAVLKAREAWGADLPDWVAALARECAKASQNKVAVRLGYSAAVVSTVLARKYGGDMDAVRQRFLGVFASAVVECPEMGRIPTHHCQDWRRKARHLSAGNAMRVRMFRACNRCPVHLRTATTPEETPDA